MKFDCGPTPLERHIAREAAKEAKRKQLQQWHPFFALRPRRIGSHDCRWLEWIERKGIYHSPRWIEGSMGGGMYVSGWWYWEYRPKQ